MRKTYKLVALILIVALAMILIPISTKATDSSYEMITINVVVIGEGRTIEYETYPGGNLRKLGHGTIFDLNNEEFAEKYDGYYLDEACTEEFDIDEYFTDGMTLYVKALNVGEEQDPEGTPATEDAKDPEGTPATEDTKDPEGTLATEDTKDSEGTSATEDTKDPEGTSTTEDAKDPETVSTVEEKDSTPKTGISSYSGIAVIVTLIALASIVIIKKRNA